MKQEKVDILLLNVCFLVKYEKKTENFFGAKKLSFELVWNKIENISFSLKKVMT